VLEGAGVTESVPKRSYIDQVAMISGFCLVAADMSSGIAWHWITAGEDINDFVLAFNRCNGDRLQPITTRHKVTVIVSNVN
jgi:hypothetical protein